METYREQLDKLDTYVESNKAKHSVFCINILKFMYWVKVKLGKKDGYIDWMSKGKDPCVMTDNIEVLNSIINDVIDQMEVVLDKKQFESFKQLEKISKLIIDNFDNPIRSNPHIIYDETSESPELDGNLLHSLENLIQIDNYLDETLVNS